MSDVHSPQFPPPAPWPPPAASTPPAAAAQRSAGSGRERRLPRDPGLDRSDISPTPLPSRPLWMIAGTVLLVGALFWGCFQVVSLIAREQWQDTYREPAAGIAVLHVDSDEGRVTVRGADTDEIVVEVDVSRGLFGIDESAERVGDRFEVSADCPPLGNEWCSADYDITVPRGMTVEIDASGGSVSVSAIDAPVDVSSDNGRVELADIGGPVRARSDNGRVVGTDLMSATADVGSDNGRVELTFLAAPESVVATSDNGRVEVAVPPVEGDYAVDASSDNGSTNVEITSNPNSSRTIAATSDNGSVTVRYSE